MLINILYNIVYYDDYHRIDPGELYKNIVKYS